MNYKVGEKMSLKEEFIKVGYTENDYNEIRNSYSLINMKDEGLIDYSRNHIKILELEEIENALIQ